MLTVVKKFVEMIENIPHKTSSTASGPRLAHLNFKIFIINRDTPQTELIALSITGSL
jgi:hypothetical protein